MLAGEQEFGAIRIGVSTLLVRSELRSALWNAAGDRHRRAARVVGLRDAAVAVDAPADPRDPERPVAARTRRARRHARSAGAGIPRPRELVRRRQRPVVGDGPRGIRRPATPEARTGRPTDLESVMDNLEDAVALFSPRGELIFCNRAMNALQPRAPSPTWPPDNPVQADRRAHAGRPEVAGARLNHDGRFRIRPSTGSRSDGRYRNPLSAW